MQQTNAEAGPSTIKPITQIIETPTPAFERWRSSLAHMTGLGLTDEEKAAREELRVNQKLERDWEQCEKWKTQLIETSPVIVFMLKHLRLSGCPFESSSIQCHPCSETRAGGFSPDFGVLLCQDRFMSKKHMEDTMTHELLHAFDHCRFKVDWNNLRHMACSEIRAANLSGDCRWMREINRGFMGFSKQHQTCVRRRAVLSVEMNPSCSSREQAEQAVNEVWDSCFKDTRPFDEVCRRVKRERARI
ncbi:hypothetical protein TREMEDRAFT_32489 [Tremella mesenterica DSM 1558]|uniref:uncharacterized protein n=1 Tax=Tremella mesenterica (strain ATCC 24925 / CBS 8224 / DSM 1558 / NBRC 9311 / NRRL Y-6157 / RJB 2259-6 / UBC 559-6) TaxID=578456 RepID=UPI0003F49F47|nr:uncharacterized protein TREMEDRAFT_32489 [Tremella mesenterica DSM 1558]EIW68181.1 hypothetical protein TREMEDRAFT_32489 [Tremella mesenterica DSM 1558]